MTSARRNKGTEIEKVETGIPGFDTVAMGGLPRNNADHASRPPLRQPERGTER